MWCNHAIVVVLFLVAMMIAGCSVSGTAVLPPPPADIQPSPLYTVRVNGKPAYVHAVRVTRVVDENGKLRDDRHQTQHTLPAAMCSFDMDGPVEVEIDVHGPPLHAPLQSVIVRPLRHAIKPVVHDNTLRFVLREPCQLSIEPNGHILAPLHLFANPPEPSAVPQPNDPNVLYYGPGEHVLGVFDQIKSGMTIYLAAGAIVRGHIAAENVSNVKIIGRGIFDLSKSPGEDTPGPRRNEFGADTRGMRWFKCRDITIDGVAILDAPSWGIEVTHCDNVTIRNVKIISCRGSSDGIDICSSQGVVVEDCFLRTHDDTLNVKGLTDLGYPADAQGKWTPAGVRKPASNIRFQRCVVWNDRAHALMIGPETRTTEIHDILYKDIDIIHALSVHALAIFSGDAALIRDVRYEDIRIEDARVMEQFGIRIGPTYVTADPTRGSVRNVQYKNIEVLTPGLHSALLCDAPEASIDNIVFENVRLDGKRVRNAQEARVHTRGKVNGVEFR